MLRSWSSLDCRTSVSWKTLVAMLKVLKMMIMSAEKMTIVISNSGTLNPFEPTPLYLMVVQSTDGQGLGSSFDGACCSLAVPPDLNDQLVEGSHTATGL